MQMTLSSSSPTTHSTLTQAFLTFKTLFNRSLPSLLTACQISRSNVISVESYCPNTQTHTHTDRLLYQYHQSGG